MKDTEFFKNEEHFFDCPFIFSFLNLEKQNLDFDKMDGMESH